MLEENSWLEKQKEEVQEICNHMFQRKVELVWTGNEFFVKGTPYSGSVEQNDPQAKPDPSWN